jgi:hypothetical protein
MTFQTTSHMAVHVLLCKFYHVLCSASRSRWVHDPLRSPAGCMMMVVVAS